MPASQTNSPARPFLLQGRKDGKLVELSISAHSPVQAMIQARKQGYSSVRPVTKPRKKPFAKTDSLASPAPASLFARPIAPKHLMKFTAKLSVMITAGLPIIDALEILHPQSAGKTAKQVIRQIIDSLKEGENLHRAFSSHPRHFSEIYLNMIKAGEASGKLDIFLGRLASSLETQQKLKSSLTSAMFYPVTLLLITIGISWFMMIKIVPVFADMYSSLGAELPLPTQLLLDLSGWISTPLHLGMILIPSLLAIVLHKSMLNYVSAYGLLVGHISLRLPVMGGLVMKSTIARICDILANLMDAGVSLPDAVNIASQSTPNRPLSNALAMISTELYSGRQLSELCASHPILPDELSHMIAAGERTGTTDEMLAALSRYYSADYEALLEGLTSIIEPIMIVFIGVVIGGLVVALYLPIFSAGDAFVG